MKHDHEHMLFLRQPREHNSEMRRYGKIKSPLTRSHSKCIYLHTTFGFRQEAEVLLFQGEPDLVVHVLPNLAVPLDKSCPQDFMPCDEVFECEPEEMLVDHSFEAQYSQEIERGRSWFDFVR
jgi:hypothetical protein